MSKVFIFLIASSLLSAQAFAKSIFEDDNSKSSEVVYFFKVNCPACIAFDSYYLITKNILSKDYNARFYEVPVIYDKQTEREARIYFYVMLSRVRLGLSVKEANISTHLLTQENSSDLFTVVKGKLDTSVTRPQFDAYIRKVDKLVVSAKEILATHSDKIKYTPTLRVFNAGDVTFHTLNGDSVQPAHLLVKEVLDAIR